MKNTSPPTLPRKLQQTQLTVINGNSVCSNALGYFNNSQIYCAKDSTSRQSNICLGDSGKYKIILCVKYIKYNAIII